MVETKRVKEDKVKKPLIEDAEEWKAKLPIHVVGAIKGDVEKLSGIDRTVLRAITDMDWSRHHFLLSDDLHKEFSAQAVANGMVMCYAFGNFYAIASHPCLEAVKYVNSSKGRPENQVGSVTTTKEHIEALFAWEAIPQGLSKDKIMGLIHELYDIGPFGFRGPAAGDIPDHLVNEDEGVRTTQIIAPGYSCKSNAIIKMAINKIEGNYLFITSANLSSHAKGTTEEPAHFRAEGIKADFGNKPGYFIIAHVDEEKALRSYPLHQPMSTSVISFHKSLHDGKRPILVLERHGSLGVEEIKKITDKHGFGLTIGAKAQTRLPMRQY